MPLIGIHIRDMKDISLLAESGGNIFQMLPTDETIPTKLISIFNKHSFVHSYYTINIATEFTGNDPMTVQLMKSLEFGRKIGALGVVVHIGKQLTLSKEIANNNMLQRLLHVHSQTKRYQDVKIIIETPSGQGTEMYYKFDEFLNFFSNLIKNSPEDVRQKFGICMDTCHLFASGVNLNKMSEIKKLFDGINKKIGLQYIKLVHLNNSRNSLGSRLDHHENFDTGYIQERKLVKLAKICMEFTIPIILETPSENKKNFIDLQKCLS